VCPVFLRRPGKANQAVVDLLGTVAARMKATPAQVALAWLLAQKPWIVPIRGRRSASPRGRTSGAASLELTRTIYADINAAAAKITVQGARYPEHPAETGRR